MTDNEMRVAIAEWAGWRESQQKWADNLERRDMLVGYPPDHKDDGWPPSQLPLYTEDLNAMHEAEAKLTQNEQEAYTYELSQVVPQNFNTGPIDEAGPDLMIHRDWDVLHATARQRCEALLKTIGRWKEPSE